MKHFSRIAFLALAFCALFSTARAQVIISTGEDTGNYNTIAQQLLKVCPVDGAKTQASSGSVQNINRLADNEANLAMVQADMLFSYKANDPEKVNAIKTLINLYPEELHFVGRSGEIKEGGFGIGKFRVGSKTTVYNTVEDLAGRKVGAVGGSVRTLRIISNETDLNLQVVEYKTTPELAEALLTGKVDGALWVGGQRLKTVSELTQDFKLLEVSPKMQKALASMYQPARLSYDNLNQSGVNTVATTALLVTYDYGANEPLSKQLLSLRACFESKASELKTKTGSHPKWRAVNPADHGKWSWYEPK